MIVMDEKKKKVRNIECALIGSDNLTQIHLLKLYQEHSQCNNNTAPES